MKGFDPRWKLPKGAQEANGVAGVRGVVREQVAAGADWIKVYADYRRKPGDPSTPTYSQNELNVIVDEARSAGLPVASHAVTSEAIRRSVLAGVASIEHGYEASAEVLALMTNCDPLNVKGWVVITPPEQPACTLAKRCRPTTSLLKRLSGQR